MPITAVIIVVLFAVQRRGTAAVGPAVRPGDDRLVRRDRRVRRRPASSTHPEILKALSPTYAVGFLFGHFGIAFFALAAVVLAVTGAEALYADMGHFGRRADHPRLAGPGLPGVHAQLLRPGRADPRRPGQRQQPVLPARPRAGRGCRWSCWPPRRR